MKNIGLCFVTALFLLSIGQATAVSENTVQPESIPNELHRSENLEDLPDIEFDESPVRYDSAGLDSFIRHMMDSLHFPGVATWCSKNGQVIWQSNYGYANLEDSIEVTDTTIFLLASISKTFVATAIMQLWEQRRFDLDEDINNHLDFSVRNPNYPDSAITFRMLMKHTSSIHDNWGMMPSWVPGDHPVPLGDFVREYLVPGGIYYSTFNYNNTVPGLNFEYCNSAIALLGYLVEAMEDSFPIHCQDSIFVPLGMNHTSWFLAGLDTNNIAVPYQWTGSHYTPYPHRGCAFYPAAQLRASAVDIARHLTAIQQYGVIDTVRILDSATVDLMLTPQYGIGLIWFRGNLYGRLIWYHGGGMTGVSALYGFCPAENSAVIVLINRGSSSTNTYSIVDALFDYAEQHGVEEHKSLPPAIVNLQIIPNPFRDITNIRYSILDTRCPIQNPTLSIYDATGRLVRQWDNTTMRLSDNIRWDGRDQSNRQLSSGIYFLKLEVKHCSTIEKLLLIR